MACKAKNVAIWPFTEKVCQPLVQGKRCPGDAKPLTVQVGRGLEQWHSQGHRARLRSSWALPRAPYPISKVLCFWDLQSSSTPPSWRTLPSDLAVRIPDPSTDGRGPGLEQRLRVAGRHTGLESGESRLWLTKDK